MKPTSNTQIKFRTCFSSVSDHGFKLDILKSGIQKYLRRRELKKMIWCVLEIYKFELYAQSDKEKQMCKGIITNLINRLIITMDEELVYKEYERYLVLRNLIEKFEKDRSKGIKCLIQICKCLVDAELYRFPSDVRAYWDYRFRADKCDLSEEISTYEDGIITDDQYYDKFVQCFNSDNDEMFYWMFKIFYGGIKGNPEFRKKKENIYKIWKMLFNLEFLNDDIRKLFDYKVKEFEKKTRGERFMFLVNSIQLVRNDGSLIKTEANSEKHQLESHYSTDCISEDELKYWSELSSNKIVIDDYVIDMHTSQGRKLGKNRKDFGLEGSLVFNQESYCEILYKDWRDCYTQDKIQNPIKYKKSKKKKDKTKKIKKKLVVKKDGKVLKIKIKVVSVEDKKLSREEIRNQKYKRIKLMRGVPDFNELESKLENIGDIDSSKITLCSEKTCGNKVMCFEYEGKIWKESRKSMNYNRDYCVIDQCKELFGLKKINMVRVLANFRIEKIDKNKKSWKDNWHKVMIGEDEEKVVYCVMNKITNCNWDIPMEIGVIKHSLVYGCKNGGNIGQNKALFKELVKIGVYRGIFRCSDFNCRNVLVGLEDQYSQQYLVSIDEGDIGKRLDIIGKREKWLVDALNNDKTIINEILEELSYQPNIIMCLEKMEKYKFSQELINEVENNWKNLKQDLEAEGVEFE